MATSPFSPGIRGVIQKGLMKAAKACGVTQTAALAIYNAAQNNTVQKPATRVGTNPNSPYSQLQRVRLSFEGENAIKNTSFARNYVLKRRMYCSSGATYAPNTGDVALDSKIRAYCEKEWLVMGINSSMLDAYARVGDCFLPERGDSALRLIKDEQGKTKLEEITGDRIGEIYYFSQQVAPVNSITWSDGSISTGKFDYFAGLYFDGPHVIGYKIYDRTGDTVYTNPKNYRSAEIIFFKDDLTGGVRGVSIFATALEDVNSRYQILKATKDTMQQQSKVAAIASNNSGAPNDYSYDTIQNTDGSVQYQETFADGAILKYQFTGDSYQVLRGEHPSEAFIGGMKYLDESAALAVGLPYEFLFSAGDSGGAPSRFAFSIASRELERIRNDVHKPRLSKIAYITIAQGIREGVLPPNPNVFAGEWLFGTLPTADAFRDDKSDIDAIRAGTRTYGEVITANSGRGFDNVLQTKKGEAIKIAMAVEDANRDLVKLGYKPVITAADIAQNSPNPQQGAEAYQISKGNVSVSPAGNISDPAQKAA